MTPGTTITAGTTRAGSHHPGTAPKDLSVVERDATVAAGVACAGCEVVACGGDQDSAPSRRNQRGIQWQISVRSHDELAVWSVEMDTPCFFPL